MKIRFIILIIAATLWQSLTAVAAVRELYVSPTGNDSNIGSVKEPLLTLQGAVARAVALQEDAAIDGFVVNLAAGTYTQYEALEIDTSLHKPIEFRGTNTAERTTISGAMQAERFTAVEDNLWRVRIPEVVRYGLRFEQIYINGERRFRAQSPNRHKAGKTYPYRLNQSGTRHIWLGGVEHHSQQPHPLWQRVPYAIYRRGCSLK